MSDTTEVSAAAFLPGGRAAPEPAPPEQIDLGPPRKLELELIDAGEGPTYPTPPEPTDHEGFFGDGGPPVHLEFSLPPRRTPDEVMRFVSEQMMEATTGHDDTVPVGKVTLLGWAMTLAMAAAELEESQ